MAGETSPGTQISQGPKHRKLIVGHRVSYLYLLWSSVWLVFFLWRMSEKVLVAPYYEYKRLGPVCLKPVVQDTQAQVEYPRRISRDDRGVHHGKRIIVSVTKTEVGPEELICLAVKPVSGHVRFLTEEGHDTSGQLAITATYGITNLDSLYIEHPNVPPGGIISLTMQVVPPTGAITCPVSIQGSDFAIEEESLVVGVARRITSLIPSQTFLLTVLVTLPGLLLKQPVAEYWRLFREVPDLERKMKQAWEKWQIDEIRNIYNEYQRMRLRVPLFGVTVDVGSLEIELLHRRAEARFRFEQAKEALQQKAIRDAEVHLAVAGGLDPVFGKVAPLLLGEGVWKLEEEYQKTRDPTAWWFDPTPDPEVLQILVKLLENGEGTQAEVRRRIVNALGHIKALEAGRAVEKALREDNDLSVQAQAGWMLARRPWPEKVEERWLRIAGPGTIEEWLKAFPSPLEYNPFETTTAEDDVLLDRHFFDHPVYRQLLDYGFQAIAIFADSGSGKTSCRRMFKSSLKSPPNLVVEYTDFGTLLREAAKISVEDHVRGILRQASALLGVEVESLALSDVPWREQLRHFLESVREKGYMTIHVLVDNVDGHAETQANLRIAELLIRHLVGNFDLLDTANLYFNFYLPLSLKERLSKYGGFTTGRIKIVDMMWREDLLHEVIKARLQAASSSRSPVDSLMAFTSRQWPINLDSLLVGQAQGSPRRLITLVSMLFQHRARIWDEGGRSFKELYITMADWATLLEHLLRQGDII